jgi:hypothetical protein
VFSFVDQDTGKGILVVFTNTSIGASNLPFVPLPEDDGPGMWVLVVTINEDLQQFDLEQAFRITDGTNILIPEVHLAELTGMFGEMIISSDPSVLPGPDTWAKCLPFARFTFSSVLPLPLNTYDALLPQLPEGILVAITE